MFSLISDITDLVLIVSLIILTTIGSLVSNLLIVKVMGAPTLPLIVLTASSRVKPLTCLSSNLII